ncbi:MAG: hypothetical protein FJ361_03375 [Gemmatimonadetes bacterium]|nr:hypothetical protein [Gemmatimonadota bacterium]
MASIDCIVDTQPMADSIERVRAHVDATTAAVIAMQAATIAAEQAASASVCRAIDGGFHTLIVSQLSQKSARAKAIVDSKLAQLAQLGEFLTRLQGQMESDFHRIKARYTQLFLALDQTMAQRVAELDRGVFDAAGAQSRRLTDRMAAMGVLPITHQGESLALSQAVSMARTRASSRAMIGASSAIIEKGEHLRRQVRDVVRPGGIAARQVVYVPVRYADVDSGPLAGLQLAAPRPIDGNGERLAAIRDRLAATPGAPVATEERARVLARAAERAARLDLSPRVRTMLDGLLKAQQWQVAAEERAS